MSGWGAHAGRSGLNPINAGLPVALLVGLALTAPEFAQMQNLANVGGQIAALVIVALGQAIVALAGGIDLSVGSVVSLATCIVATTADPVAGVALALLLGSGVGLVNGIGVAYGRIHPLVMTLGTMTFVQGLARLVLPIPGGQVAPGLRRLASDTLWGLPYGLLWCLVVAALVALLLHRTRYGLRLIAVGAHEGSAALNGIDTRRTIVGAYASCGLLAALAGIYLAARVASGDALMGAAYGLESIAAIALGGVQLTGGTGSIAGVLAGVLSLGLITNGINLFGVSPFMRGAITGLLLLLAVCAQRRRIVGL